MLILEIGRTAAQPTESEARKLASDPTRRLIGIRQQEFKGRTILLVHTAKAWDPLSSAARQIHVNDDTAFAGQVIERMAAFIRSHPAATAEAQQAQTNLLAHARFAIARLESITAPEMREDAGKWTAVTDQADADKRTRRAYGTPRLLTPMEPEVAAPTIACLLTPTPETA